MIRKILVANRGEIACRVFRTARQMGIRTVAVFSDADQDALHVRSADEAFRIGSAPAADSYLHIDSLLQALATSGADAVHPGYGFLAENPAFAEAIANAGATFIGPPPAAMRAVGDKRAARCLMRDAGLPVVPGAEDVNDPDSLRRAAEMTGYPLMVKAAAGGGGRGMRKVEFAEDLDAAYETCQREARATFGDGRLLVERCIEFARHIEVQIFADSLGNFVHLFERDCSAQRRHQKILEEAPAPDLEPGFARQIRDAAVAAARAVGYVGAGTVEFLVPAAGDGFYFLEMNARLQVEHPVTEAITGLDLVEWQIRVAAKEPLPAAQSATRAAGHAIEARFCAEDPANAFMPAPGYLHRLDLPQLDNRLRIDSGVESGDRIPPEYDSMIAKIIAHGRDRQEAIAGLLRALSGIRTSGPPTNLEFLLALTGSEEFRSGTVDTGLVERMLQEGRLSAPPPTPEAIIATAVSAHLGEASRWRRVRHQRFGGHSPFSSDDSWRLGGASEQVQSLRWGNQEHTVRLRPMPSGTANGNAWFASLDGATESRIARPAGRGRIRVATEGGSGWVLIRTEADESDSAAWWTMHDFGRWRFTLPPIADGGEASMDGEHAFRAPLPGHILQHHVRVGDLVNTGDALVTVEAMKTEHTIRAPAEGRIIALHGEIGGAVEEGEELLAFEALADGQPAT